jgi:hypothetical protein
MDEIIVVLLVAMPIAILLGGFLVTWHLRSSDHVPSFAPVNPVGSRTLSENITMDDSLACLKITIKTQKRWSWFVLTASQWLIMSLCIFPIAGLGTISILKNYLPQNMMIIVWISVGALLLFLLYIKFVEVLEYVFDTEVIEIDNQSVRIEKYGLGLKNRKEYPAENIKWIVSMPSLGGINLAMRRFPLANSSLPAFMLWHHRGIKRYRTFGRAIDYADAQSILGRIYSKFPRYRGTAL